MVSAEKKELLENLSKIEKWAYSTDPKAQEVVNFRLGEAILLQKICEFLNLYLKEEV